MRLTGPKAAALAVGVILLNTAIICGIVYAVVKVIKYAWGNP